MKAFILAAGLGTRLKPFTEHHPKALVEINGKPLLQRTLEQLKQNGVLHFVINVHHFADQIIDFLESNQYFGTQIEISDERESLLDTGGAILKARHFLENEPDFLLHNVDILSTMDYSKMIENHLSTKALVTLAVRKRISDRNFLFDHKLHLCGWKNNKTKEELISHPFSEPLVPLAFSGIHILRTEIFNHIRQLGKFSIVETYLDLSENFDIRGFRHDDDLWLDVGKPAQLEEAKLLFM